jgi:hypothetical protein
VVDVSWLKFYRCSVCGSIRGVKAVDEKYIDKKRVKEVREGVVGKVLDEICELMKQLILDGSLMDSEIEYIDEVRSVLEKMRERYR